MKTLIALVLGATALAPIANAQEAAPITEFRIGLLGGENAQVDVGVPQGVTGLFQGLLLFFLLASDFLVRYRITFVQPRREVAVA